MHDQLNRYHVSSAIIFEVAGGNGLISESAYLHAFD